MQCQNIFYILCYGFIGP
uniref:Uncharacterized protein n=1 Tax=Rhizophora mucronata TaxID=61149 RepID=A0A2P2P6Y6_RHIMU